MQEAESSLATLSVIEHLVPGPSNGLEISDPNTLGSPVVPVREYAPSHEPWATMVWVRGGSFSRGNLEWPESHWVAQRFAEAGVRVFAVDYGLASETLKAPAPANDVLAVFRWVAEETPGKLVLGGASAGGHLAMEAAISVSECGVRQGYENSGTDKTRMPDAMVLEYPTLHRVQREDPEISRLTAELPGQRQFGPQRIVEMYDFYLGAGVDPAQSLGDRQFFEGGAVGCYPVNPRVVGETPVSVLADLPPTVLVNAERDDLRASGEQFATQLQGAGVSVFTYTQPETVHGYLNRPDESEKSLRDARSTIELFVSDLRKILMP